MNRVSLQRVYGANAVFAVMFCTALLQMLSNLSAHPLVALGIAWFSSLGFYRFCVQSIFILIDKVPLVRSAFLGRSDLAGYWSYSYDNDGGRYIGVWRIDQDSHSTKVVGFGLDKDFAVRSDVRSLTDLMEISGGFEVVNVRSDSPDKGTRYFSKTTLIPEYQTRGLRHFAYRMRGETVIYGGPRSGRVHDNLVFLRHFNASCEEDVVKALSGRNVKPLKIGL